MVVVRPRRHDQVGPKRADQLDDPAAVFQRRQQLAIVDVEQLVADADRRAGCGGLGAAALGQPRPADLVMPSIAIGHRDKQHLVALPRVQRRHAAGGEIAVVGVCAEHEHAQSLLCHGCLLAIACRAYCTAR